MKFQICTSKFQISDTKFVSRYLFLIEFRLLLFLNGLTVHRSMLEMLKMFVKIKDLSLNSNQNVTRKPYSLKTKNLVAAIIPWYSLMTQLSDPLRLNTILKHQQTEIHSRINDNITFIGLILLEIPLRHTSYLYGSGETSRPFIAVWMTFFSSWRSDCKAVSFFF